MDKSGPFLTVVLESQDRISPRTLGIQSNSVKENVRQRAKRENTKTGESCKETMKKLDTAFINRQNIYALNYM